MTWHILIRPRRGATFVYSVYAADAATARELARLNFPTSTIGAARATYLEARGG